MSNSFAIPWTEAHQAPLSMGFPKQEYWSWLTFLSPGDLRDPGIESMSPACQADLFVTGPPEKLVGRKNLLMKAKESEKASFKLNIQNTKIMASGPITSWQIDGETVETDRLHFLGLQNHCRW